VGVVAKMAGQVGDPDRATVHVEIPDFETDEKTGELDSLAAAHRLDARAVG
jgi:hypothetical protein